MHAAFSGDLELVKLLLAHSADTTIVSSDNETALMVAGNFEDVPIIQYLIDKGADLRAHDLGKKNDGQFGSSIEPLMPLDYAIGVGTFRPNNAIVFN